MVDERSTVREGPNFGPYASWESVAAFSALSEQAFAAFDETVEANWKKFTRPVHHLFIRMAYQAKSTSLAVRLNTSWALLLPAFALTRVRLEQTIVSSYLMHEDESIGLEAFVRFLPIGEYKGLQAAMEDQALAKELARIVDLQESQATAAGAQDWFTPGFSLENDRFERSWTKLNLRSMAKRRDSLVRGKGFAFGENLERSYVSIYKTASSVIHADCSSLAHGYLNLYSSPSGQLVLMPVPTWAIISTSCTACYDIIQCYEILNWLGIAVSDTYLMLGRCWMAARDKYIP
ncbi:MAG: DUF5677 domain-containing protein [Anaerolineae bacterium]